MAFGVWRHVFGRGLEAQRHRQFQQETDGVVAEIALQGVQRKDSALAPVEQSVRIGPVADGPVQDLAHKEGDGVFQQVSADTGQRMPDGQGAGVPQGGPRVFGNDGFQQVQRQEKGHSGLGAGPHQKTPSPVCAAQGMQHHRVLSELGVVQYDELCRVGHFP